MHEIRRDIDSAELSQWMVYDKIEPFTVNRAELMLAQVLAMIANITQKKRYKPDQFLLFGQGSKKPMIRDMKKLEKALGALYGRNK